MHKLKAINRKQPAIGFFLLAIAALMVLATTGHANIVANPGFEQGSTNWSLQTKVSVDSTTTRTGSRSLKLISDNSAHNAVLEKIGGIKGGAEYVYTVWVKGN